MITPNEWCRKCRYADCSTTIWPCSVCKRIHDYDDYFVPAHDEDDTAGGEEQKDGGKESHRTH